MGIVNWILDKLIDWLVPRFEFHPDETWLSDLDDLAPDRAARGAAPSEADPPVAAGGTNFTAVDPHPAVVRGGAGSAAGAPPPSDEVLIEELVADYRRFLRACFRK